MAGHWRQQAEGGGRRAFRLIRAIALGGGRPLARACLYPVTLYYYLRRGPERLASRQYLARALGRPAGAWQVLRHMHCFAATLVDRMFLLARGEQDFEIETEGLEQLEARIAQGRGVLLLGSHQGSFDALRALAQRCPQVPLRIVMDKFKTPALTEMLEELAPGVSAQVIDASGDGASVALAVAETCHAGGMAALLADRGREREALRRVPFLGRPAPFPVGPWLLAAAVQAPVVLCFGLYLGGRRYRLVFEPLADRVEIPRADRGPALDALIARYARRLEHYVGVAPYNWFNFYDFWQEPDAGEPAARADADLLGERYGT
jgi:predicted LPLAT superfamily acyltransferase